METYCLKEKLSITKDFLDDLTNKSWSEIESLQSQIANIDNTNENTALIQLLNNLLTSYYVFVGGLENLLVNNKNSLLNTKITSDKKLELLKDDDFKSEPLDLEEPSYTAIRQEADTTNFEPFEYFVDFEEPSGIPITDKDLYG